MTQKQKWITSILGASVLLTLAGYLKFNDPENSKAKFLPCVFNKATGYHCPGCGSTRAAHALLNFDISRAWKMNPAFVISLPAIAFGFTYTFARWVMPKAVEPLKNQLEKLPSCLPWLALGLLLVFGVLRNLPFEPFTSLAPG